MGIQVLSRTVGGLLVATLLVTSGAAQVLPVSPVLNGEFEIAAEAARPAVCLAFGDGYVNIFEPGNPLDLPWLVSVSPCQQGLVTAAQWSHGKVAEFADFDGDGDREAKVLAVTDPAFDPSIGTHHNFWQAYPSPHQLFVADFDALTFRVEDGTVPAGAFVQLSLSNTPLGDVSPWLVLYFMCSLTFRSSLLVPDADGVVTVDPLDGDFASRDPSCDDAAGAFNAPGATADDKRAVLATLRLVQHSYWGFNTGAAPVVLDGIDLVGARTAAEAALDGVAP